MSLLYITRPRPSCSQTTVSVGGGHSLPGILGGRYCQFIDTIICAGWDAVRWETSFSTNRPGAISWQEVKFRVVTS